MFDYPKFGKPRTDTERRKRHKGLYGTFKLPPRGKGRVIAGRRNPYQQAINRAK